MELITFKTNISSEKALQRVAPLLNNAVGSANWQLDIMGTEKKLMVYSPGVINEMKVIDAVHKAGFYAVNIEDFYAIF
ncbi:heavy metal transport/detoxification protein [Lacibacter sp. H375]|uniref:heavy metal transport/detoxification protein n=1 Tax=Lacibacter sp. H375 TaxID=3133424 RepID=UPI0030C5594C